VGGHRDNITRRLSALADKAYSARFRMNEFTKIATYPILPLRDIVVFPHMIVPLFVGREKSVRALERHE